MSINSPLVIIGLVALSIAGTALGATLYFVKAPGKSFKGALPALTAVQIAMRDRIKADVEHLAVTIGPRDLAHSPKALAATAAYINDQFKQAGYTPRRLPFPVGDQTVENLDVELIGTSAPKKVLVIGAHYDSVPTTPGADDNASGVAVLLELARALRKRPAKHTIRFVAFTNEEPPHFHTETMGSLVYAKKLKAEGVMVTGMISLEMLGYFDPSPNSQQYPPPMSFLYPNTANFIAFVADTGSRTFMHQAIRAFRTHGQFPSEGIAAPRALTGIDFSDHWSFWQTQVPALMVTDTSFFRYSHYHEATDTVDRLDYERMAQLTTGLIETIWHLANKD